MDKQFLCDSSRTRRVFKVLLALSVLAYLLLLGGLFKSLLDGLEGPKKLGIETVTLLPDINGQTRELRVTGDGFAETVRISLSYDVDNQASVVGSLKTWSHLNHVVVRGDQAFLATQHRGLQVLDVANPRKPKIVGTIETPGLAWGVCLDGDHAYVADGPKGLQVVSILDPSRPLLVGDIKTAGPALAVEKLGRWILAAGDGHITAIGVDLPNKPVVLHSLSVEGRVRGITVQGERIYLANGNKGVMVLRFDPRSGFNVVQSLPTRGTAESVSITDKWLLVGCGQRGVEIFALHGPNPKFLAAVDTPGFARGIAVSEKHIFVADNRNGLQILEGSPENGFRIIKTIDTPGNAHGVTLAKGFIFVTDGNGGLQIIDGDLSPDPFWPELQTTGITSDITAYGDQLFLADGPAGVKIIEIKPAGEIRVSTAIKIPGYARKLAVARDRLYVAGGKGGLSIVDISKDKKSRMVGTIQMPDLAPVLSVATGNDLICVAAGKTGLVLLDMADRKRPYIIGRLSGMGTVRDLVVVGDQAFLAAGKGGVLQVSLKDPRNPVLVGQVDLPRHLQLFTNATAISATEDKLLLANSTAGCQVFDIRNPHLPRFMSTLMEMGNVTWVKGVGDRAYMFDFEGGLHVVDLRRQEQPQLVGRLGGSKQAKSVAIVKDKAYVSLGGGVKNLPLPVELPQVNIRNSREMILQVPPSIAPGNYFLTMTKGSECVVLNQVVTIEEARIEVARE